MPGKPTHRALLGLDSKHFLFRLAWDTCCSAFASRQVLYERFFQGDALRNAHIMYDLYDKKTMTDWVQAFLEEE